MTESVLKYPLLNTELSPAKANEAYLRQQEDLLLLTNHGVVNLLVGALRTLSGDYKRKRVQVTNPSENKDRLIGFNFLWNISKIKEGYQADSGVMRLIRQNGQIGLYFPRFLRQVNLDNEYDIKRYIYYSLKERPIEIQVGEPLPNLSLLQRLRSIRQGAVVESIDDVDDFAGRVHLTRWPIISK